MISDTLSKLESLKKERNDVILAHPECDENILSHSDHIGSTTSIFKFAYESNIENLSLPMNLELYIKWKKKAPIYA